MSPASLLRNIGSDVSRALTQWFLQEEGRALLFQELWGSMGLGPCPFWESHGAFRRDTWEWPRKLRRSATLLTQRQKREWGFRKQRLSTCKDSRVFGLWMGRVVQVPSMLIQSLEGSRRVWVRDTQEEAFKGLL